MNVMKILGYLMVIAVLEGALHEYLQVTTSHSNADVYHAEYHTHVSSTAAKKELSLAWYEIIMILVQDIWGQMLGAVQWVWHSIHKWIELMLVVFECSELVHKLSERFNLW